MADEAHGFSRSGVSFPLTSSTSNSLLQDADPALFYLLEYLSWIVTNDVGDRLEAEATVCGAPITNAVEYTLPYEPSHYLASQQVKFPLIAVWRDEEQFFDRTRTYRAANVTLHAVYVLPVLSAGQAEQLLPILSAIGKAWSDRVNQGSDPEFTPTGQTQGSSPFAAGGVEKIDVTAGRYVVWNDGGDLTFHAYMADIEMTERATFDSSDYDDFDGINAHVDYKPPTGATIQDIAEFET